MPTFSVIIPSLNEESRIEAALQAIRKAVGDDAELLVVDGGSTDATRFRAARLATVLSSDRGRGAQLNTGARAAQGEILLFIHADTLLESEAGRVILARLQDPRVVGGCCRFAVTPQPSRFSRYRLLEAAVNLRTRIFHTATGDQAIFVRRDAFVRAGGFPDFPLFEDVELVRKLRRLGRFAPTRAVARTSRRRWEQTGFWRTVALHWGLRIGYWVGISPHRLAAWYGKI